MTARTEIRLSGLGLVLAAVLWIISEILEMIQGGFSPLQLTLTATAFTLLPYGFLGIHRAQAERGGILSFFGAICSGISFIIFSGDAMIEIVLGARETMKILETVSGKAIFYTGSLLCLVGVIVFGIAIVRARVFPRWTGIVFVVVNLLILLMSLLPPIAFVILNIVFCLALCVQGWYLWSEKYENATSLR